MKQDFKHIKRVFIANRGEIVSRILNTLKKLGLEVVVIYAADDRDFDYIPKADFAVSLGDGTLAKTYLNQDKLIDIALKYEVDAIHPGYGFLSENAGFAQKVKEVGMLWVGPDADAILQMGNKPNAQKIARENDIPVMPRYSSDELLKQQDIEFPIILKPADGGGGKGMRILQNPENLKEELERTATEAERYFGSKEVYAEIYLEQPRHIEVQVLADNYGNSVHLFERECSVQRRYQKIVEEAPAVGIHQDMKDKLYEASKKLVEAVEYKNAGTVEFLVKGNQFYFLEMNTRIQVEHPVTEAITGMDLVEWQLRIADGQNLTFSQNDIQANGVAIETRIYAEDAEQNFLPTSGKVAHISWPKNARVDSALTSGQKISVRYDPMLAKVITHGSTRTKAIEAMQQALDQTILHGLIPNVPFLQELFKNEAFLLNDIHTQWCDAYIAEFEAKDPDNFEQKLMAAYVVAKITYRNPSAKNTLPSVWNKVGYWRTLNRMNILIKDAPAYIEWKKMGKDVVSVLCDGDVFKITLGRTEENKFSFLLNQQWVNVVWSFDYPLKWHFTIEGVTAQVEENIKTDKINSKHSHVVAGHISSPLPGKVLEIKTKEGMRVKKGDTLLIIESMKMENNVLADADSVVKKILVKEGQQLEAKEIIVELE